VETADTIATIGEMVLAILQCELEISHNYCESIQDLRQDVRQVRDGRGGADLEPELRRRAEGALEARREMREAIERMLRRLD
jgi:hypothetical protein